MRWVAAIAYLVAGGWGVANSFTFGLLFAIVFAEPGQLVLLVLMLASVVLTIAGVLGMFSPVRAATLAGRTAWVSLAALCVGAALQAAGKLTRPTPVDPSNPGPDLWFWGLWVALPALLLVLVLWSSRRVRA